jgi:hypothetical protein
LAVDGQEDSLRIRPPAVPARFTLQFPLIRLAVTPGLLEGEYRAQNDGALELTLAVPPGTVALAAELAGAAQAVPAGASEVILPLRFRRGDRVPFLLRWK